MGVVGWAMGKWHISRTVAGQAISKRSKLALEKKECRQR
jgi:hypothetical protein